MTRTLNYVLLLFILSTCLHMTDLYHCGMSVSEVVVQMRVVIKHYVNIICI